MAAANQIWLPFAQTFEKDYKLANVDAKNSFLYIKYPMSSQDENMPYFKFETKMFKSVPIFSPNPLRNQKPFRAAHTYTAYIYIVLPIPTQHIYGDWTKMFLLYVW